MADSARWSRLLEKSTQPLFVLNQHRRVQFVNAAWEALTRRKLDDVRGSLCKRRSTESTAGSIEALQHTLAPPEEALEGKPARVRRRYLESRTQIQWWDIDFLPFGGGDEFGGLIGKITVVSKQTSQTPPLPEKIVAIRQQVVEWYRLEQFSSSVPSVERLTQQIRHVAKTKGPVTIVGESGAGKQWTARAIHYQSTPEATFACVDCSALPETCLTHLLSSEGLTGTVYLKEPGHLPRELQGWLRNQLSSGEAPRLFAGFTGDPQAEIRSGRLLEDFYCAISPVSVQVPPLRERLADLPWFLEHFQRRISEDSFKEVSPEAQGVLRAHSWPGNLSELFNTLRSAVIRAKTARIEAADLPFYMRGTPAPVTRTMPLDSILEQVEKRLMLLAMNLCQNNKTKAAEMLSIWRPRLVRRLEALGMPPEDE